MRAAAAFVGFDSIETLSRKRPLAIRHDNSRNGAFSLHNDFHTFHYYLFGGRATRFDNDSTFQYTKSANSRLGNGK